MEEIAIVRCLQNASGAISKMRVLQAFKDVENFRKILYYALNPMLTYKISEQTLRTPVEYDPAITITMTDIFEICELLAKRKALDAATVYQVRVFVQCLTDPESSEFYIELLSKTLRLGVTAKTVNKVIPGLIPEWEVQQAYPIDKYPVLYHGKDQTKIDELLEQMVREDKEGLMVNFDVPYKRKRHNGILKVKRFYTMDLHILRCEEGSGRLAGTLGAFVLDYKGNEVNVGSGFSDEQRTAFWAAKDEMPGRLCEVKYKEISYDKNTGAESLQFPVFISIRTDKDEVSYG